MEERERLARERPEILIKPRRDGARLPGALLVGAGYIV